MKHTRLVSASNNDYYHKYMKYKQKYLELKGGSTDTIDKSYRDKILATLYGNVIGDALGARYEFLEKHKAVQKIEDDMINGSLEILGGGPFNAGKGQVSDDSEMMMCLLNSLVSIGNYDQKHVAQQYIKWFNTNPIDIGNTIRKSLFTRERSKNNLDMVKNSSELNYHSLSNGLLMRISPLGIMNVKLSTKDVILAVEQEADLTHPNPIIKEAGIIFCIAIKKLIKGIDKKKIMIELLRRIKKPRVRVVLKDAEDKPEPTFIIDERGNDMYVCTDSKKYQGYFGIALQNAFYELLHGTSFEKSMIDIIKRGGDTDTNCAIAGALLGAYYGMDSIKKEWLNTVKNADYERKKKHPFLDINRIDKNVDAIMN